MIETERLLLRAWREDDLAPYAQMNADPQVREFFPSLLTREESDAEAGAIQQKCVADGFCFFAAELRESGKFAGFVGMQTMKFALPGVTQPAVEIGWRLARHAWGKGLATEAARAVVDHAFQTLRLPEVVAIVVPANVRSRRVMDKLGMKHREDLAFDHPRIAEGHPLRRHLLYELRNDHSGSFRRETVPTL